MTDTRLREEICRLGRSLFERGLTPGSSGNISVKLDDGGTMVTPTNVSLGSLDPARLSRLSPEGKLISGDAPTKEVPLHTALYQTRGAARAVVHLHSSHSVALSMLPEIDPRAALPPMTPYYLMKCGLTALVPYYRPGDPAVADAIKGLAGKYSSVLLANHGRRVRDRRAGRDRQTLSAAARTEPAFSHAGAGRGSDESVRAGIAGAWALAVAGSERRHHR
jgi:ribulose-5-phosphate 4-epimerase/fuculose-1-phosphate aldolase